MEELLDCYFRACSIRVSAADLARIGCVLACHGQLPGGERLFPAAYGRFVNANLMTCGMYDGSGDFAIRVGVPAKSGVGGGIMAVVPGRMALACLDRLWTKRATAWPESGRWSCCPPG